MVSSMTAADAAPVLERLEHEYAVQFDVVVAEGEDLAAERLARVSFAAIMYAEFRTPGFMKFLGNLGDPGARSLKTVSVGWAGANGDLWCVYVWGWRSFVGHVYVSPPSTRPSLSVDVGLHA